MAALIPIFLFQNCAKWDPEIQVIDGPLTVTNADEIKETTGVDIENIPTVPTSSTLDQPSPSGTPQVITGTLTEGTDSTSEITKNCNSYKSTGSKFSLEKNEKVSSDILTVYTASGYKLLDVGTATIHAIIFADKNGGVNMSLVVSGATYNLVYPNQANTVFLIANSVAASAGFGHVEYLARNSNDRVYMCNFKIDYTVNNHNSGGFLVLFNDFSARSGAVFTETIHRFIQNFSANVFSALTLNSDYSLTTQTSENRTDFPYINYQVREGNIEYFTPTE
jgi:hypothetical protein